MQFADAVRPGFGEWYGGLLGGVHFGLLLSAQHYTLKSILYGILHLICTCVFLRLDL